jgi:hypothetical protein
MRFVNGLLSALAGILTGLSLGYVLWGAPWADLSSALATTSAELDRTKGWLLDEIQNADAQHRQLSGRLTQALADLAKARAELARATQTSASSGGPAPGELSDPGHR